MKIFSRNIRRWTAIPLTVVAGATGAILVAQGSANAQNDPGTTQSDPVTTYELGYMPQLQPVNGTFKFQARISQGGFPVDANFPKVYVNLKSGNDVVFTEQFENVKVKNSVLNLTIGGTGGLADLKTKLAEEADLAFQVCLNDTDNCLKAVALSTVPYSIKSEYSLKAEMAQKAQVAAQCHYTHRATADADLFTSGEIGTGYYDFYTPTDSTVLSGLGQSDNVGEGYIQWSPLNTPDAANLNICAKTQDGQLVPLKNLRLHGETIELHGDTVGYGSASFAGATMDFQALSGGVNIQSAGNAFINSGGDLTVSSSANLDLQGAAISVTGATTFLQNVRFEGGVSFPDDIPIAGDQIAPGAITTAHLADEAVNHQKIKPGSIRAEHMFFNVIDSPQILPRAVQSSHIDDDAVGSQALNFDIEAVLNNSSVPVDGRTCVLRTLLSTPGSVTSPVAPSDVRDNMPTCDMRNNGTELVAINAVCTWLCFNP